MYMKMHASRHVPDFIAKKIKRVALLVFWFFGAWASPAFGDPSTALVTLNCKDESLKKVLLAIQDQTKYNFSFGEEIESIDGISIRVKAQPLSEVLRALLGQARVSFVLEGSMIVVKKSKTKSAALPSANPMPESRAPIKVSGTVTDSSTGDPIPGVNVTVKGTTQGVSTDAEGKYVLVIENPEAVLVFSFLSYVTPKTTGRGGGAGIRNTEKRIAYRGGGQREDGSDKAQYTDALRRQFIGGADCGRRRQHSAGIAK